MSKPLKKGKKAAGAQPRTPPKAGRKVVPNPVPKSPPSPYSQAVMFALALIVTGLLLFVAMRKNGEKSAEIPQNWAPTSSSVQPVILPPTEPPPYYSEPVYDPFEGEEALYRNEQEPGIE